MTTRTEAAAAVWRAWANAAHIAAQLAGETPTVPRDLEGGQLAAFVELLEAQADATRVKDGTAAPAHLAVNVTEFNDSLVAVEIHSPAKAPADTVRAVALLATVTAWDESDEDGPTTDELAAVPAPVARALAALLARIGAAQAEDAQ